MYYQDSRKMVTWPNQCKFEMNYPDDNSMQLSRESIYFYVYVHCKKA